MKRKILVATAIIFAIVIVNGIINNHRIVETSYALSSNKINKDYTFSLITDYHSNTKQSDKLIDITKKQKPDYILLAGDILESDNMDSTVEFIGELTEIGTVIYARGNHDDQYQTYDQFKTSLEQLGVIVLGEDNYQIGDLNFIGIEDIDEAGLNKVVSYGDLINNYQGQVAAGKYNILLGHRPNYLEEYSKLGVDLVVSGHAHGGQWQIPFTDIGVIAPDEGFFPTHVHGIDTIGDTTQIISSGTSNPYRPFVLRFFNPEEVVLINLNQEQ